MSRMPSNTEQFLGGLASAQGFIGQAGANQQAKMNFQLAQQQMGLEREKMAQQGQQFQQGLQAEAENYRKLNESRERLQAQELGQAQSQFTQRMGFDREMMNLERLTNVKMKQLEMDLIRNEHEIAALGDDDPRVQQLVSRRRQLKGDLMNLDMMIGSSQTAMALAGDVKEDRMAEVDARLNAYQGALSTRATNAEAAFKAGLDYAVLRDAQEGGFIKEMARASVGGTDFPFFSPTEIVAGLRGEEVKRGAASNALRQLGDSLQQWAFGQGDPEFAKAKATEFQKSAPGMAAQVVHNALTLNRDAFGLQGADAEKAARIAVDIVANAALIADVDPRVRVSSGGAAVESMDPKFPGLKMKIASGIGELRKMGMGDEQISAIFNGLESMSENRVQLLSQYEVSDPNANQAGILDRTLGGVGRLANMIELVANDQKYMQASGGRLVDHSKYDWVGVTKKARIAYGMGQSSELQQLMGDLDTAGMTDADISKITELLISQNPDLQFLRPEQYAQALKGMGLAKMGMGLESEFAGEDVERLKAQVQARGRLRGLSEADQRLAELSNLFGG